MFWVIKMQEKKVCLVIGAGAGIGVNVARKFASSGYHSVISRRTNQDGLDIAVKNIEKEGGAATGYIANKASIKTRSKLIHEISDALTQ